jgi:hypothetical protein
MTHGGVVVGRKHEADPGFADTFANLFGRQVDVDAKRGKRVGRPGF